jgi:hypothetical protein
VFLRETCFDWVFSNRVLCTRIHGYTVLLAPIKALPCLCIFRRWRKNPSHSLCGWSVTPALYGLRIYCESFFRLAYGKFKVVNSIILFNFNMLYFFCLAKKARVQNFEPHSIIEKCFKNNRFINLLPDRVKNYEPNP